MTLQEIERRLQRLEDLEEIKTLTHHYIDCLLYVKWDDLVDCFTENAIVDIAYTGPRKGKESFTKLFKEEISTRHIGKEHVLVANPVIKVDGDKAMGSWVLYFMFTESDIVPTLCWQQGPYEMHYEKENGKWKISYLHWRQRVGVKPTKLANMYNIGVDKA
jgi:hypothetical protein